MISLTLLQKFTPHFKILDPPLYLFAYNKRDQFRENKYSNFIQLDTQGNVILEFTSYIPANNKIQIRGVDVKRFGLDSSRNHSVVDNENHFVNFTGATFA